MNQFVFEWAVKQLVVRVILFEIVQMLFKGKSSICLSKNQPHFHLSFNQQLTKIQKRKLPHNGIFCPIYGILTFCKIITLR
jgi:hypothetical protein